MMDRVTPKLALALLTLALPAACDGGGGARAGAEPAPFENVYWGPEYSDEEIEAALDARVGEGLRYRREEDPEQAIANALAVSALVILCAISRRHLATGRR